MSTLSIQAVVSKYHFPPKGFLGKVDDFKTDAENVQDEPGSSSHPGKQESYWRQLESCQ